MHLRGHQMQIASHRLRLDWREPGLHKNLPHFRQRWFKRRDLHAWRQHRRERGRQTLLRRCGQMDARNDRIEIGHEPRHEFVINSRARRRGLNCRRQLLFLACSRTPIRKHILELRHMLLIHLHVGARLSIAGPSGTAARIQTARRLSAAGRALSRG